MAPSVQITVIICITILALVIISKVTKRKRG